MEDFPQNYNDLTVKFELESQSIEIVGLRDGEEVTNTVEFGYLLLDSTIPSNVFAVKYAEIDQLDTHDPFSNQLGYRQKITDTSCVEF